MSQFTKKAIIHTFLTLLNEQSLDKITVKDIVSICGINRNTFYYYYKDIYDLIEDIFEMETAKVLSDQNLYDTWYEELRRVALFIMEYRPAILHIYDSKSRDVLENYLFTISGQFLKSRVEQEAKHLSVSEKDKAFICTFYGYSLAGMTLSWIKGSSEIDFEDFLKKSAAILEHTVPAALSCCISSSEG